MSKCGDGLNLNSIPFAGEDAGPQIGGPNQYAYNGGNDGILAMGWGSGTANVCGSSEHTSLSIRTRSDIRFSSLPNLSLPTSFR